MHKVKYFANIRKKSKYHNTFTDYAGTKYHSKKESKFAQDCDWRVKAGELISWERQKKMELYAYGKHICDYWIDFVLYHADGTIEYVEVKGFVTDVWRLKWKLFEAQMNEIEPRAVLTVIK